MNSLEKTALPETLDSIVTEFENSWCPNRIKNIQLKMEEYGRYDTELLVELIRVDLEFNWRKGFQIFVEDYQSHFEGIAGNSLNAIAFEEYRCRFASGDAVSKNDYQSRLSLDTSEWPEWKSESGNSGQTKRFPNVGDKFLEFEILGILGQGAVGQVFLAKQIDLASRLVVLKVTAEETSEPDSLAQLQHTNIVPIYSLHQDDGFQVICMPFLGVTTLRDVVKALFKNGNPTNSSEFISTIAQNRLDTVVNSIDTDRLKHLGRSEEVTSLADCSNECFANQNFQDTAVWLIHKVAEGLNYAHSNGILHGDIKPENILLQRHAEPLILDFHLSTKSATSKMAPDGGTLPYMSPEHLLAMVSNSTVDSRSDIYSLGVLLFELLCGQPPHPQNGTPDELFIADRRDLQKQYSIYSDKRLLHVSPDLKSIVDKCIRFNPEDRFQTAAELATDLNRHLNNRPLVTAPNNSISERSRKWMTRNKQIFSFTSVIVSLAIVSLVTMGIAWSWYRQSFRLEQADQSRQFISILNDANLRLSSIDHRETEIDNDIKFAETSLASFQSDTLSNLTSNDRVTSLNKVDAEKEFSTVAKTNYWLADAYLRKAVDETASHRDAFLSKAKFHNSFARGLAQGGKLGISLQRSAILSESGQKTDSQRVSNSVIDNCDHSGLVELASALYAEGEIEKAIRALDRYLATDTTNYAAWLLKGNYLAAQRQLPLSKACYSVCIGIDSSSSLAYFYRGMTYLAGEEFQNALSDFQRANRIAPGELSTLLNMALCHLSLGDWVEADKLLTKATTFPNAPTRIYFLRSTVRGQLGRDDLAEMDFETAMKLKPRDEISWISRGFAKSEADPQGAVEDFESALLVNPNSAMALQNIAAIYAERLGEPQKAIESINRIIEFTPNDAAQIATRGVLYARMGKRDLALQDAKKAMEINAGTDILFRVAGIYAQTSLVRKQDAALAIELISKAAIEDPHFVASMIEIDEDLTPIRASTELEEIMNSIKHLFRSAGIQQ